MDGEDKENSSPTPMELDAENGNGACPDEPADEPDAKRQRTAEAEDEAAEQPGGSGRQGKVHQKKCQFRPYDTDEKKAFSCTAVSSSGETRPITALDDCIQSLTFVLGKLVKSGLVSEKDLDTDKINGTFSFCVGLFLEFCWLQKVCLNGREFRQWSTLRGELQSTLLAANEQLAVGALGSSQATGKTSSKSKAAAMSALELAEMLCQSFLQKPVTSIDWECEDADEQVIKSVANSMTVKGLATPVRNFVVNNLHHPLAMHEALQDALKQAFSVPQEAKQELVDVLAVIYTAIELKFPPAWSSFAFDVVTAFADRNHFVEGTEQARVERRNLNPEHGTSVDCCSRMPHKPHCYVIRSG